MQKVLSALSRASALAGILGLALAATAQAKVLAKVDGVEITDSDLKTAMTELGPTLPQQLEGKARDAYVLDYLIDVTLVAKKGEAEKLGDSPEFKQQMAFYRQKTMMEAVMATIAKTAVTDEAVKAVYDTAAKNQKAEPEAHARHILVSTEDEAKAALARVKGGEDFAKVAGELSKDPGSQGGDLGWFTKERMVPEFAEAAFKLEPGQISDPVKSQFGWHIIKLEEKRSKQFPPLETVKDQVTRYVLQKAQSDVILKLREAAKVERTEPEAPATDLAPATPAPDNAPAAPAAKP